MGACEELIGSRGRRVYYVGVAVNMMTVYARKLSLNDCFFIFRSFPLHDFQLLNGPLNYSPRSPTPVRHAFLFRGKRIGSYSALFTDWGWSEFDCDFFEISRAAIAPSGFKWTEHFTFVPSVVTFVCFCFVETWPISWLLFNVTSICFGLLEHHMLFVVSNFRPWRRLYARNSFSILFSQA